MELKRASERFRRPLLAFSASPHASSRLAINEKRGDNVNIEELIFDVVPEDAQEIFKKRTAMQWDRKKKKFVQMSGGVDPNGLSSFSLPPFCPSLP